VRNLIAGSNVFGLLNVFFSLCENVASFRLLLQSVHPTSNQFFDWLWDLLYIYFYLGSVLDC